MKEEQDARGLDEIRIGVAAAAGSCVVSRDTHTLFNNIRQRAMVP